MTAKQKTMWAIGKKVLTLPENQTTLSSMKQPIKGIQYHPEEAGALLDYSKEAPDGTWTGRLDYHAWGLSTNLFCYFTDEATGQKYRLSVFHRQCYQPYKDGPNFAHEPIGGRFEITTGKSKKSGLPTFLTARKLDEDEAPVPGNDRCNVIAADFGRAA